MAMLSERKKKKCGIHYFYAHVGIRVVISADNKNDRQNDQFIHQRMMNKLTMNDEYSDYALNLVLAVSRPNLLSVRK